MSTTRRWLLLPVIAAALVLGGMAPASADFAGYGSLAPMSVGTLTVAPPTAVSTAGTYCFTTVDPVTLTTTTWLQAQVSWTPSTTARGVTGYVISAHLPDGSVYPVASTDAATTSVGGTYDGYYATLGVRVSVTTTTSYGWTADSELSQALTC
jgi:hypothetical protein